MYVFLASEIPGGATRADLGMIGESGCHTKLVLLFETLHRNPSLCKMIKKLGTRSVDRQDLRRSHVDICQMFDSSPWPHAEGKDSIWTIKSERPWPT